MIPSFATEIPPTAGLQLQWRDLVNGAGGRFEESAAAFLGVEEIQLECSGTAALIVALMTLRRESQRRKVIIPAYTCPLVAIAIVHCGLEISLCDLAPNSLDMDEADLARLCDDRTLAVIPTHLAGRITSLAPTLRLARAVGAWVIEDAAQAFGGRSAQGPAGTLGDIGFFSLAVGKGLTIYEGGFLYARNADLRARMRRTSDELISSNRWRELWRALQLLGYAAFYNPRGLRWLYGMPLRRALRRGDIVGAAGDRFSFVIPRHRVGNWRRSVGDNAIDRLPHFLRQTTDLAARRIAKLRNIPDISIFTDRAGECGMWPTIVMLMPNRQMRDAVLQALWPRGLGVGCLFAQALPDYDYLRQFVPPAVTPNARDLARRSLTLSNSPWATEMQTDMIHDVIVKAARPGR